MTRPFAPEAAARAAPRPATSEAKRLVERTLATMRAAGEIAAPATVAEALAIHHIARDRAAALLA